jgi:hypothetical protein
MPAVAALGKVNGRQVEVVTEVRVEFKPGQ